MTLTEEQARSKWCPNARVAIGEDITESGDLHLVAANRADDYANPHSCRCLASECMAWRWHDPAPLIPKRNVWMAGEEDETLLRSTAGPDRPPEVPSNAEWVPMTGSDADEDWEGGYWQELEADFEKAVSDKRGSRRGFCGAFGAVAVLGGAA